MSTGEATRIARLIADVAKRAATRSTSSVQAWTPSASVGRTTLGPEAEDSSLGPDYDSSAVSTPAEILSVTLNSPIPPTMPGSETVSLAGIRSVAMRGMAAVDAEGRAVHFAYVPDTDEERSTLLTQPVKTSIGLESGIDYLGLATYTPNGREASRGRIFGGAMQPSDAEDDEI